MLILKDRIIIICLLAAVIACKGDNDKSGPVVERRTDTVADSVDQARLRFQIGIPEKWAPAILKMIRISVFDGQSQYFLAGGQFSKDSVLSSSPIDSTAITAEQFGLFTRPLVTALEGNLDINIKFVGDKEEILSEKELTISLKPDWEWTVMIRFSDREPHGTGCRGCTGFEEMTIPEALVFEKGLRLFVFWGGNSIKNPVIY
nr:hypothetical protein [candidate division Zixibacteria bacterium]